MSEEKSVFRSRYLISMVTLLAVTVLAGMACGGDGGGGQATATIEPFASTGTQLPSIAPDETDICSGELFDTAVESIVADIKIVAEQRGLTVGDEDDLSEDSKTALDDFCAEPDPASAQLIYCEDLLTAITNNVTGDEAARQQMLDYYGQNGGCGAQ